MWGYGTRILTALDEDDTTIDIDGTTLKSGLAVDVTEFLGTAITETTGGRFAGNLSVFWDNDDADTTKTVDDIGGTATVPPRIE